MGPPKGLPFGAHLALPTSFPYWPIGRLVDAVRRGRHTAECECKHPSLAASRGLSQGEAISTLTTMATPRLQCAPCCGRVTKVGGEMGSERTIRPPPTLRFLIATGALLVAMGLVACAQQSIATPTPVTPTPMTPTPVTVTPAVEPTLEAPVANDPGGNPSAMMRATLNYLHAASEPDTSLIRRMGESGDTAFVPVLVDLLFFRSVIPLNAIDNIPEALTKLTGEDFGEFGWPDWFEWLGRHSEVRPPPGYAGWKGQMLSSIDRDFSLFLYDGVKARIRLEEIAWGGVRKDGIPDLIDPPLLTPDQATYLNLDDLVFGVSINGEHRAYPLRIMNPHEMANDIVGGEPIALAY